MRLPIGTAPVTSVPIKFPCTRLPSPPVKKLIAPRVTGNQVPGPPAVPPIRLSDSNCDDHAHAAGEP